MTSANHVYDTKDFVLSFNNAKYATKLRCGMCFPCFNAVKNVLIILIFPLIWEQVRE